MNMFIDGVETKELYCVLIYMNITRTKHNTVSYSCRCDCAVSSEHCIAEFNELSSLHEQLSSDYNNLWDKMLTLSTVFSLFICLYWLSRTI